MAITEFTEAATADCRKDAINTLARLGKQLDEIYLGADNLDSQAWNIIGVASDETNELLEKASEELPHIGLLCSAMRRIVALVRGAQLVLEAVDEGERGMEDEAALSILSRHAQRVQAVVAALKARMMAST